LEDRKLVRRALATGIAAAVYGLAAPGAAGPSRPADAFDVAMQLHQGYFSERCVELAVATLRFEIDSPHPVEFNIHHHTETSTDFPVAARVEEHFAGTIELASPGEYCFMLRNLEDRAADFTIRLSYEASAS
jgi:hypothetical protein